MQYTSRLPHLRSDLRVVVTFGYRLGWRVRSEVLTLENSQLDLDPWKRATAKAGLPGLLIHDLRRSAVRNMVYKRYAIVSDSDMKAAAQRLETLPCPCTGVAPRAHADT